MVMRQSALSVPITHAGVHVGGLHEAYLGPAGFTFGMNRL